MINLDGGWGDRLKETLAALDEPHPDRFCTFALINFDGIDDEKWTQRETARLEESFNAVQRSRDQMETLLNGIQDAVFAVSAEERVIWSNGALARLPLKARHGQGVLDTVRDPSVVAAVKEALATRTVQRTRATSVVALQRTAPSIDKINESSTGTLANSVAV